MTSNYYQLQRVYDSGIPHDDVIARLRQYMRDTLGTERIDIAADAMTVNRSYLCEVLNGHRVPSPYLLSLIGLQRKKVFIYQEAP